VSTPQPPDVPEEPTPPPPATPPSGAPPGPEPEPAFDPDDHPSTWQPMLYLKIGALLLVIAYVIAFIVDNSQRVRVHFVFTTQNVRLIWMLLVLLAVGLIGGMLISQLYRHRRREHLAKQARKAGDPGSAVVGRDEAERKPG
jgi:uncharacterized integral membrane protein